MILSHFKIREMIPWKIIRQIEKFKDSVNLSFRFIGFPTRPVRDVSSLLCCSSNINNKRDKSWRNIVISHSLKT